MNRPRPKSPDLLTTAFKAEKLQTKKVKPFYFKNPVVGSVFGFSLGPRIRIKILYYSWTSVYLPMLSVLAKYTSYFRTKIYLMFSNK